jgi:2-iminobutanoate/2-iminopropanoate deaminase
MLLNAFNHTDRPVPSGFNHAIEVNSAGRILFVSGQVAKMADGTVPAGIMAQTQVALAKLNIILEMAGMTLQNVAKMTIFLVNEADYPDFASVYFPAMPSPAPAATGVVVKALVDPRYLVEIEAIAVA